MFSLQLPKTSLRFQLADVPTGAPVDDREETIADTHAALSKLLADCKKYVGAVVASCVMVGGASMAQEAPQKNNIPVGTVATQPVGKEIPGAVVEISFRVPKNKDVSQKNETDSSPSATLQAKNGYGQVVEFNGEKISVAELQAKIGAMSPEERTKAIKEGMNRNDRLIFKTWEAEVAIAEGDNATKRKEVAIKEGKLIDTKIEIINQESKVIDGRIQAKNQEFIKKAIAYVETVENNDRLLNNPKVISYLKKLLQDDTLPPDLLGRIDVLIGIGG